jgi:mRNA interferase MazF
LVSGGAIVWLELELEGHRPVYVLSRDEAIDRLANIVVATITSRLRGLPTGVRLGTDDGMPQECVISLDNLRTVPKALLTEPITKLAPDRVREVCQALNASVDC